MGKHIKRILTVLMCTGISFVQALSIGGIVVETALNQPLKATIGLRNLGANQSEDITVSLARPADFEIAGIEYLGFLNELRFNVVAAGASASKVEVTSTKAIREPYVNFLVSIVWPNGRLLKEYTILLDPVFGDTSLSSVHTAVATQVQSVAKKPQYTPRQSQPPTKQHAPRLSRSNDNASSVTVLAEDTLWNIAKRAAPTGVSVHQVMHALKAANPDAFINNNINGLKAGYQLAIPSNNELKQFSLAQAVSATRRDTALWSGGTVATPNSSIAVSNKPAGELQLAAADDASSAAVAGEQSDLLASENDDLSNRVGSLEDQVDDLNRLLALKNKQLALLQQQAVETLSNDQILAGEVTINATQREPEESVVAVEPADAVVIAEAEQNQASALAATQTLKGGIPQKFEPQQALWQQAPLQMAGLGGACLLLLGVLWLRRGRAEESFIVEDGDVILDSSDEEDDYIPLPESDEDDDAFDELEDLNEQFKVDGYDVAMAMLEAKVTAQAHRADLRLLLLQKSAEADDKDRFIENYQFLEAIAKPEDLQTAERILTVSQGSTAWLEGDADDDDDFFKEIVHEAELTDEIEALLMASEGEASLDDQQDVEDFDFESVDEQVSLDEPPLDAFDEPIQSESSGLDVSLDVEPEKEGLLQKVLLQEVLPEDELTIDSDDDAALDFEQTLIISPEQDDSSETSLDDDGLDFDFDLAVDETLGEESESDDELNFETTIAVDSKDFESFSNNEQDAAVDEVDLESFDDISFDSDALSLDDTDTQNGSDNTDGETIPEEDLLAFDGEDLENFDLGEDLADDLEGFDLDESPVVEVDLSEEDLDIQDFDFDLDSDIHGDDELVGSREDDEEIFIVTDGSGDELDDLASSSELDDTDDIGDFAGFLDGADEASIAGEDEIATKLELGEAFVEMGDISGAKEILMEVLEEGDVVQQATAREMLDKLDS